MQPLHAVSHSFQWGDEQQSAFEWLKQRITGRDIGLLHFLDYGRDIHVAVDASEDGAGGVLYQLDTDGKMQIAAFASRAFNQTERKWSTLEQECYALLHWATKFETFLLGHHFHLHTDHRSAVNKLVVVAGTVAAVAMQACRFRLHDSSRAGNREQDPGCAEQAARPTQGASSDCMPTYTVEIPGCNQPASPKWVFVESDGKGTQMTN
jgi:hypothetical protein